MRKELCNKGQPGVGLLWRRECYIAGERTHPQGVPLQQAIPAEHMNVCWRVMGLGNGVAVEAFGVPLAEGVGRAEQLEAPLASSRGLIAP
jgi:hypothetical protein